MRRSRTTLSFLGAEVRPAPAPVPGSTGEALSRLRRGRPVGPGAGDRCRSPAFLREPVVAAAGLPVGGGVPRPRARDRPGGLHHRGEWAQQRRRGRAPPVRTEREGIGVEGKGGKEEEGLIAPVVPGWVGRCCRDRSRFQHRRADSSTGNGTGNTGNGTGGTGSFTGTGGTGSGTRDTGNSFRDTGTESVTVRVPKMSPPPCPCPHARHLRPDPLVLILITPSLSQAVSPQGPRGDLGPSPCGSGTAGLFLGSLRPSPVPARLLGTARSWQGRGTWLRCRSLPLHVARGDSHSPGGDRDWLSRGQGLAVLCPLLPGCPRGCWLLPQLCPYPSVPLP
ncbi:uncharacterized protein LOC115599848 [Calypte anna]|uniref:uncharacterized protein LOC115599848 n=1 Tax=Calypte anna TaxID=9244 RepID=UPI0011C3761E|nr:uncharacterized protein LOC115599848 [Calypte anna]